MGEPTIPDQVPVEWKREVFPSNPYCMRCGDTRGGPYGHETNECVYRRKSTE